MAVVWVEPVWPGEGSEDDHSVREYRRMFKVKTNSLLDSEATVLTAPGIPAIYEAYVGADGAVDTGVTCRRRSARQTDEVFQWEVEAEYSTETADPAEATQESPLEEPPQIRWGVAGYSKPARNLGSIRTLDAAQVILLEQGLDPGELVDVEETEEEAASDAITSSAKEAYDPGPEVDAGDLTLVVTRNEATFDANLALTYTNAINSDTWIFEDKSFAPKLARCKSITSGDKQFKNGISFYAVTYEIQIKLATWDLVILDYGTYYLQETTTTEPGVGTEAPDVEVTVTDKVFPRDKEGNPLGSPVLLDGSGGLLADDASPKYRAFQVYRALPFTSLALP